MDGSGYKRARLIVLLAASMALGIAGVAYAAPPAKASTVWAEVLYEGSVQASSGGISVTHPGSGVYLVNFGKDVTHCGIVVTSGIANEPGVPILGVNAEVATPNPPTPAVIQVREDVAGTPQDYSFSVVAVC